MNWGRFKSCNLQELNFQLIIINPIVIIFTSIVIIFTCIVIIFTSIVIIFHSVVIFFNSIYCRYFHLIIISLNFNIISLKNWYSVRLEGTLKWPLN